ncbi:MAG: glycosyltransferase family 2 protein [Candidatus Levyibacteriota bacterium]
MPKISVVLAVLNEEKNLSTCLDSVKDFADEIVIVDGSSTDKTVEIAKKYGARIEITANLQNFHINKQKAIDMANGEWVLQLDADERVTPSLCDEIKNQISKIKDNEVNGYWIPRKNWFLGRFLMKGGQYPDYQLRFYKKGKGRLPQKDVHEQTIVQGQVGYLKNPLVHFADPNFSRYLLRFNRYTDFMANELKNKKIGLNPLIPIRYLLISPVWWFLLTYIRHKGFVDSWQGFVFSFFSALRFPVSYVKYIKLLF